MRIKNYHQMMCGSWDMVLDGRTEKVTYRGGAHLKNTHLMAPNEKYYVNKINAKHYKKNHDSSSFISACSTGC